MKNISPAAAPSAAPAAIVILGCSPIHFNALSAAFAALGFFANQFKEASFALSSKPPAYDWSLLPALPTAFANLESLAQFAEAYCILSSRPFANDCSLRLTPSARGDEGTSGIADPGCPVGNDEASGSLPMKPRLTALVLNRSEPSGSGTAAAEYGSSQPSLLSELRILDRSASVATLVAAVDGDAICQPSLLKELRSLDQSASAATLVAAVDRRSKSGPKS
ncbi:hypothetical protein [Streptomyces sp. NPDC055210]